MSKVIDTPKKFKKYILSHPDLCDQEKKDVLKAADLILDEYFSFGWMGHLMFIECEVDIPKRLGKLIVPYLKAYEFSYVSIRRKWFKRNVCVITCYN